jgi:hypothetical protein
MAKQVDSELYGFLIFQFALQPRTPAVMSRMVTKAKQFLRDHDCSAMDYIEQHTMVVGAVAKAMDIPENEMGVRTWLANHDQNQVRNAHASMVRDGQVGLAPVKTWLSCMGCAGMKHQHLPQDRKQ